MDAARGRKDGTTTRRQGGIACAPAVIRHCRDRADEPAGEGSGLGELARRRDGGQVKMKSRPRSAAAMSEDFAGTRAGNQKPGPWTLAQRRSRARRQTPSLK
jgi:hypothetical protein